MIVFTTQRIFDKGRVLSTENGADQELKKDIHWRLGFAVQFASESLV